MKNLKYWNIERGVAQVLLSTATLLLAACGGASTAVSPPAAANRAPTFTSGSTSAFAENGTAAAYQAAATDADGNPIVFTISGGADSARFTISSTGQLRFVTAPNFDLPADSNGDNIYEVQVSASDGTVATPLTVSVTVTNDKEGVAVRRVGTGFAHPVAVAPIDSTRALVAEKSGAIYILDTQTGVRTLLTQIADVASDGMIALATDSTFASTGSFFALYISSNNAVLVNQFLRNPAGPTVPNNFGPAFGFSATSYGGGGSLALEANGDILVATSDAAAVGDLAANAQDTASRFGKVFRLVKTQGGPVDAAPFRYVPVLLAKGVHRPSGIAQIAASGGLLIADAGDQIAEEIDFLPGGPVLNFGWPFREGTRTIRGTAPAGLTDPVIEYPHVAATATTGQGVIGGAIGNATVPSLLNQFVFADRGGAIFSIGVGVTTQNGSAPSSAVERRYADFAPDRGALSRPVAITASAFGGIFIVDDGGDIFFVNS